MLKKDNVLGKNGKLLTITKSQVNRILKDKYGKPLRVRKVFYLDETAKKIEIRILPKNNQNGHRRKKHFFYR